MQEIAGDLPVPPVISHFFATADIYVYRYGESLNGIDNTVVLISYPEDAFHVPITLMFFISTDISLITQEILYMYMKRIKSLELFFRQSKDKLSFNRYQVHSSKGIWRYWLLVSLVYLIVCIGCSEPMSFEDGYDYIYSHIQEERFCFSTNVEQGMSFLKTFWPW